MNARMPHWLALITVLIVGIVEGGILHFGAPPGLDGVVLGKVLGTMDSALMLVLGYYFGSSSQIAPPHPPADASKP